MVGTEGLGWRSAVVGLFIAVFVVLGTAGSAGAAGWTLQTTLAPQIPEGSLAAVSCAPGAACVAVGDLAPYSINSGIPLDTRPLIERRIAGRWLEQEAPSPAGAFEVELTGVSCATTTSCEAVGFWDDGEGDGKETVFAESFDGTRWTPQTMPQPDTADYLYGISCSSANACTAVGDALVERFDGSSWTVQSAGVPSGGQLVAVSCPSDQECMAVGSRRTGSAASALAERWDGSSWSDAAAQSEPDMPDSALSGVACVSLTACEAVGDFDDDGGIAAGGALAEGWNGSTWTLQAVPAPSDLYPGPGTTGQPELDSVSCAAATDCQAVGDYVNSSDTRVSLAERFDGTVWSVEATPADGVELLGVSCTSGSACAAVGLGSATEPIATYAAAWDGSAWSSQPTPGLTSPGAQLNGVSCAGLQDCVAVGTGWSTNAPLSEEWNGAAWTFGAQPAGSGSLIAISCPAVGTCMAVGTQSELLAGGQWTIEPAPGPDAELNAVSCSDATDCVAVGDSGQSGDDEPTAEQWTGTSWSVMSVPAPAGAPSSVLSGVSCSSPDACTAIGSAYSTATPSGFPVGAFAERWDGGQWTIQTVTVPPFGSLEAVSCPSENACVAVGSGSGASWDPSGGWSSQTIPAPPGSTSQSSPLLTGISCPATGNCTASGYTSTIAEPDETATAADAWDGTSWTAQSPLDVGTTPIDSLGSIACSADEACIAVGNSSTDVDFNGLTFPLSESDTGGDVPTDVVVPTIAGSAAEGETLTVMGGQWVPTPTEYAEQWEDCDTSGQNCTPIEGATGSSYTATPSDVGHTITVVEGASDAHGTGVPVSATPTAIVTPLPVPVNTALPAVSGLPIPGQTLSVSTGQWSGSPTVYGYQWADCIATVCTAIAGATEASYTLSPSDLGATITALVSASNDGGTGTAVTATASGVVVPPAPQNTTPPAITGKTIVGQVLSADAGEWANAPESFSYQWERCSLAGAGCTAIVGAVSSQYGLVSADAGFTLRVLVSATDAGGTSPPASSGASTVVTSPVLSPHNITPPAISGSPVAGRQVAGIPGIWNGTTPLRFVYQWWMCRTACALIAGATATTYTPTRDDVGGRLELTVAATNAAGSASALSARSAPVTAVLSSAALRAAVIPTGAASGDAALRKNGGANLRLTTPVAGTLHVQWLTRNRKPILIARVNRSITRAGTTRFRVTLTRAGRAALKSGHRLRLIARGSFAAVEASIVTISRTFTTRPSRPALPSHRVRR